MCCRYFMELSPELRPYIEAAGHSPLRERMVSKLARSMKTGGEVRPTDIVPVIAPSRSSNPAVFPMVWGFSDPRTPLPIVNARVETAGTKPMWKDAWEKHRCVVPASWYYEWEHLTSPSGRKKSGQKYMIQPKNSSVTYLAGLYRMEERGGIQVPVFAVLTREPGEGIRFIHDRMPVILPEELVMQWIAPEVNPAETASLALTDMVYEKV